MRVFVALNLTQKERARLAAAARPLREAAFPVRWLPPENVHLTLKFLGELGEEIVPELAAAVGEAVAGSAAFEMKVGGFGAFPSLRRPSVVWVGIELGSPLRALQEAVEAAAESVGFSREDRPFRPHLTVGRAQKRASPGEFRGFDELVNGTSYADCYQIRAVDIMRSRLMPSGALYDVLHSFELNT
jgi:2'-5' RNA ligase